MSVTDRCDFRCVYCMSEHMEFLPKAELLTLEELDRLCSAFVGLGVEKLRITGGEPLVRKGIMTFFRAMSRHLETGALQELTLTTNGSQLRRFARELADCGVRRVNVSLDTLDPEKFARITRWGRFAQVMDGIDAAVAAGLKVKINTVALKGVNEDELARPGRLVRRARLRPHLHRGHADGRSRQRGPARPVLVARDLRRELEARWTLADTAERTGGPARYVRVAETGGRIGFITPLTPQFLRELQPGAADLHRPALHVPRPGGRGRPARACCGRTRPTTRRWSAAIAAAIARKPKGHDFDYSRRTVHGQVSRHMSHTGG